MRNVTEKGGKNQNSILLSFLPSYFIKSDKKVVNIKLISFFPCLIFLRSSFTDQSTTKGHPHELHAALISESIPLTSSMLFLPAWLFRPPYKLFNPPSVVTNPLHRSWIRFSCSPSPLSSFHFFFYPSLNSSFF